MAKEVSDFHEHVVEKLSEPEALADLGWMVLRAGWCLFFVEVYWQFLAAGCSVYSSVFLHPRLFQASVCVPWGVLASALTLAGTGKGWVCAGRGRAAGGAVS